jgi:pimeloyl-ACP methyl ester carboxylesterase
LGFDFLDMMTRYLFAIACCISLTTYGQIKSDSICFASSGATLSGTLFVPAKVYAAVVLVHGSGQEKRMTGLAYFLAQNGIAVLTYDKRGVGQSGGTYAGPEVGTNNIDSANISLLATDAAEAMKELTMRLPGGHGPVGLLGFSQAGWVIPVAAKKSPDVNFMVLFSGPVITTLEQLRFQFYTAGNAGFWNSHTEDDALRHIASDADRYEFIATDPREVLRKLSIPGLWIFGAKDIQVPVKLCIARLEVLQKQGKAYTFQLFPELGHDTGFSRSQEPINSAINWIKNLGK